MRFESETLETPASVAAGAARPVDRLIEKTLVVTGTFNATLRLQGSMDGLTWADLTGDITAAGVTAIGHTVRYVRVNTTAFVGGAPAASVGGLLARGV